MTENVAATNRLTRKHPRRKKGFISGLQLFFLITVVVAMVAVTSVIGTKVFGEFNDRVQSDSSFSNASKNMTSDLDSRMPVTMDWVGVIVFFTGFVAFLISSYQSTTHPLALGVAVLLLVLFSILPMILSNVWDEFSIQEGVSGEVSEYPNMSYLLDNYAGVWIVVFSSGIITGVFGRSRGGSL